MHPLCEPLSPLLGTWSGAGAGSYPTISDFDYTEELTFSEVGKPFLVMIQRSQDPATGEPLHAEAGYLRAIAAGRVELVVAQPSGIAEIDLGTLTSTPGGIVVDLESAQVAATPTAKEVIAVRRRLEVDGATLVSELWMAAAGERDLIHHVRSELTKR